MLSGPKLLLTSLNTLGMAPIVLVVMDLRLSINYLIALCIGLLLACFKLM